jgi:hypothetical protein
MRIIEKPMSHPITKEQAVLMLATRRITEARLSLSERLPIEREANIPMRWNSPTM